ncbi:lytic transglycosylase domain-containing protein [Xanthobacter autotrophicus]|uniref:lytic transglycosylase domain-containing protein n=1 Tax=Xanthobacter autotrophicus TaxID=280 RepID=UPI001E3C5DFA|nr:lytic transglycosylase domain-containing protein [Xanthobacter autotrophicus]UDQ87343.1 lytic transglycosylase domain-containing protein [Xanthobacter autotrophicus]
MLLALAAPALAQSPGGETVDHAICRLIDTAAGKEGLPASFLTRLIWQESSFRPDVVSRAGAQGIAQFMPGTAKERGLIDPFDPEAAIPASAALIADLNRRFGNLGLAAAAYNAGPGRVNGFLSGGGLPNETRAYVRIITGRTAEDWAGLKKQGTAAFGPADFPPEPCLATVASLRKGAPAPAAGQPANTLFAPWGVQISGNYSRDIALASFRREAARAPQVFADLTPVIISTRVGGRGPRTFYRVRLPAQSKAEGMKMCDRLRKAGGACLVLPN